MKNLNKILTLLITIISLTTYSQNESIWMTVDNIERLQSDVNFQSIKSNYNLDMIKAFPSSRTESLQKVYEVSCECDIVSLYSTLHKVNGLSGIEWGPKYEILSGEPNDYSLSVSYDYALELIDAMGAWEITEGDSSIVISITDAGYRMDNYELYPKVVSSNLNFNQTNPDHGTAVATTAAGYTNNGFGKSSIGYKSSLDLRTMSYNALLEASYAGARVVNASWAASCFYSQYGQDVINEVYNNGTVIVAAAGNGSTCNGASNLVYPASYQNVISVTSVGPQDNHERFPGNPSITHQHNSMVDLCAPGYDVFLTTTNGNFLPGTGTSFAAPYVSGTIALMLAVNPCLTPDQIETILKSTTDTTLFQFNQQYQGLLGSGRLNSAKAVEMAKKFSTINASVVELINCDDYTKQLSLVDIQGVAPYTIQWSNGDTGENCYPMWESGEYEVFVKDSEGCVYYKEIMVEQYTGITADIEVTDVSCHGGNNGEINVVGNSQYTYELVSSSNYWGPENGSKISNLFSDVYSLIITDEYLCSKDIMVVIQEPSQLISEITTDLSTSSINLSVTGGVAPYTYEWVTNNATYDTEDLENVESGFYQVLITDDNGCTISDNIFLNENTASISDLNSDEFVIYPNPSNGNVKITTNSKNNSELILTNVNGQNITKQIISNNQVDLNELPSGIYIVTIDGLSKKLIIN